MSVKYAGVLWNKQKKRYDRIIALLAILYLMLFVGFNILLHPTISPEALLVRSTATLALLMLHVILAIGPMARINTKFLPLLYNRRHLGVSMFLVTTVHVVFSIIQFHSLGNVNAFVSLFASNTHYDSFVNFPFQVLGFYAFIIFLLMAATSHDFWLKNLSPRVWKSLHMLVYIAYALIIMHVMLGVIQLEKSPLLIGMLAVGMVTIITLHLVAAYKTHKADTKENEVEEGFVLVSNINNIKPNRAKVVTIGNESIAVFKYDGKLSAVHNACKHQNGPLGEGKIIDGCITCPWHGYQYKPQDGCAPEPFTEKLHTYELKLKDGKVYVNPMPKPEGTYIEPLSYE